jgi:hypothetical protein
MQAICAYSVSGFYGPVYRYLYYTLMLASIIFYRTDVLVRGALGTSMIYSSIAAVHGVALASVRGRGTVDLDIIPIFAITGVGMLAWTPIMVWSKTLREAKLSVRMLLFIWVVVMWVGVIASMASMKALPEPQPCTGGPVCEVTCRTTLPMRDGQPILAVVFKWKGFLFDWSGWFTGYGSGMAFFGMVMAAPRKHPFDQARAVLNNRGMIARRKYAGRIACCSIFAPIIAVGLAIAHSIIPEVILMGPHGLPCNRNFSAISQWGPLVGAVCAQLALIIQQTFAEAPAVQPVVQLRDVERTAQPCRQVRPAPPPASANTPLPTQPSNRFDYSTVFKEGHWWGRGLEGYMLTHEGIRWRVQDGALRRVPVDVGSGASEKNESRPRRRLTL